MAELNMNQKVIIYVIGTIVALKLLSLVWRIYSRKVFAYCVSRWFSPMVEKTMERLKRTLFGDLSDVANSLQVEHLSILEIGVGSGVNLKFYPKGTTVYPLDPNPNFNHYLEENKRINKHVDVKPFVECYGEDMSGHISDHSIDVVVCTLTLCSVSNTSAVLSEVKRVLKQGGKFYFVEHVAAEKGTWRALMQLILTPFCVRFSENCHWNRETWKDIDQAGFRKVEYRIKTKNIMVTLYGSATN